MKRIIFSTIALSMLAMPAAYADYRPQVTDQHVFQVNHDRGHVVKKHVVKKARWARGHRLPGWQSRHVVRDYKHYRLRKPGRGQQWVRVGNDYLLISIGSGIIAGLIAGR